MRIAWLSHAGGLGGAELSLVEGAAALTDLGMDVQVLVPERRALAGRLTDQGIAVSLAPAIWWVSGRPPDPLRRVKRGARLLGQLPRCRRLAQLLRELGPDVVITNTLVVPTGAIAAKLAGIPHVWYLHEFGAPEHGIHLDLGERMTFRLIRSLSDAVLVNSHALGAHARERGLDDIVRVVYYAVDVPDAGTSGKGSPRCRFRVVQVGGVLKGRRQEDAVRAVAMLVEQGIDVELVLLGTEDPSYGAFVRELVRAATLDDRVRFSPFSEDPSAEMVRADVVLNCSVKEGFGRATVEAMKLGKIVVGAASGGTAELIRHGWNGLLYPPGDERALADTLALLRRDVELGDQLARRARKWATSTFTSERFGRDLLTVLEAAAASGGGHVPSD